MIPSDTAFKSLLSASESENAPIYVALMDTSKRPGKSESRCRTFFVGVPLKSIAASGAELQMGMENSNKKVTKRPMRVTNLNYEMNSLIVRMQLL